MIVKTLQNLIVQKIIFFLCKKEIYHYTVTSAWRPQTTPHTVTYSWNIKNNSNYFTYLLDNVWCLKTYNCHFYFTIYWIQRIHSSYSWCRYCRSSSVFVVFLIICFFKRRRFQRIQSNQQQAKSDKLFNNTTYDDKLSKAQIKSKMSALQILHWKTVTKRAFVI